MDLNLAIVSSLPRTNRISPHRVIALAPKCLYHILTGFTRAYNSVAHRRTKIRTPGLRTAEGNPYPPVCTSNLFLFGISVSSFHPGTLRKPADNSGYVIGSRFTIGSGHSKVRLDKGAYAVCALPGDFILSPDIQCIVQYFVTCLPTPVDMQISYSIAGEYNYIRDIVLSGRASKYYGPEAGCRQQSPMVGWEPSSLKLRAWECGNGDTDNVPRTRIHLLSFVHGFLAEDMSQDVTARISMAYSEIRFSNHGFETNGFLPREEVQDPTILAQLPIRALVYTYEMHLAMSGKRLDPPGRVLKPNGTTLEARDGVLKTKTMGQPQGRAPARTLQEAKTWIYELQCKHLGSCMEYSVVFFT
ncbi:hypothetical protein PCH_Pc21g07380 [Penicillium rubens Wisconsin 54-1255]|uniref:Uncharacterized protein n=1 Tax=Penicillium rubens (strain ATCC 28089 / DSM 1075 / NRRL 1951 / Wisconsin 54-1255) TaxID=500485 RepID=B6HKG4_PENRW|nr:hypothetical protein PCH_Pc21g07380 [Penicillium rubens Wisconsin 54-1255]